MLGKLELAICCCWRIHHHQQCWTPKLKEHISVLTFRQISYTRVLIVLIGVCKNLVFGSSRESIDFCEQKSEIAICSWKKENCSFVMSDGAICSWAYTGLGIHSFQKNVPFFPFFSILYKRTFRSFSSL